MSDTPSMPASRATAVPARWLQLLAPALGVLTALMVILYGVVLGAPGGVFIFLPAFVPVIALAVAVGDPPKDHPGRLLMLAMAPVAVGVLTAILVFGSFTLGEAAGNWWWVVGGLLSAAPFLVTGLLARRHARSLHLA